jgi:predicted RNase H-like HicB family nuclease
MLKIETERESDGRWIGEVSSLPGMLAYGVTKADAAAKVTALARQVIADRLQNAEQLPKDFPSP